MLNRRSQTALVPAPFPVKPISLIQNLDGENDAKSMIWPIIALTCATIVSLSLWYFPTELPAAGRMALGVTAFCVIGWTMTPVRDSVVAMTGAIMLVGLGVIPDTALFAALGHELVWLLLAAFVIAAILKSSGLLERTVFTAARPFSTVSGLLYGLTGIIAMTAFVVPSTSGRAALMLPVFIALADNLPDRRLLRPLALLFPTVILLSAGGSLIGAGAHFIAIDTITRATGETIGFAEWMLLAFPFAILCCFAATWLIIRLFVPKDLRRGPIPKIRGETGPLSSQQKQIAMIVLGVIGLWMTKPLHGFDIALVAIAGAAFLLAGNFSTINAKDAFKSVEIELIIFIVATTVIAGAIMTTGADKWLVAGLLDILPPAATNSAAALIAVTAAVAIAAHVAVNSRTARAAILIPALAIPMAGFGPDLQIMVLLTVLGTGFCQTLMASAKPVVLYGNLERETFVQSDLFRLSISLAPLMFALLVGFALYVWPVLIPVL